jgi:hypothetical protein
VTVTADGGLNSISGVAITNGTVEVPDFTPGTTGSVVVTAIKAVQGQSTSWSFNVKDQAGKETNCA